MKIKNNSLDIQVGGNHYKKYNKQPIEFIVEHDIPAIIANPFKYLCRFRDKDGERDLNKTIHYMEIAIDLNYINPRPTPYKAVIEFTNQLHHSKIIKDIIVSVLTTISAKDLQLPISILKGYRDEAYLNNTEI